MILWLALLLQEDAGDAARKAIDKTAAASYTYKVSGKYDRTGEFKPEAVLTCTIRKYRSARNGERVFVKGPEGLWKTPTERLGEQVQNPDRDAADIVTTLRDAEPPHKMLRDTLDLCRRGTRADDRPVDGLPCRVYWFTLSDAALKDSLDRQIRKSAEGGAIAAPDWIHWASMRSSVRVWVGAADGRLVQVRDERSVKIGYKRSGAEETRTYLNEMTFSLSGWGATKIDLPKEVAEKLGIGE
ncbi:MAG: hypothetical protein HYY17_08215 [Planctomycetes bacterium]|nr:hypothetical protein [Planctomycetota bacterium]